MSNQTHKEFCQREIIAGAHVLNKHLSEVESLVSGVVRIAIKMNDPHLLQHLNKETVEKTQQIADVLTRLQIAVVKAKGGFNAG